MTKFKKLVGRKVAKMVLGKKSFSPIEFNPDFPQIIT